jgi:hypothetical protein
MESIPPENNTPTLHDTVDSLEDAVNDEEQDEEEDDEDDKGGCMPTWEL